MTSIRLLRWSSCNGVGGRSKRLAELLASSGEDSHHQSPSRDPAPRRRRFQTMDPPDPTPTLAGVWRIRFRRGTIVPMMHLFFIARLWDSLRAAAHEFKISRMMRRSNSRFRVVEVRKSERRRLSSSGCGPRLSRGRTQVKSSFRRKGGVSVVGLPKSPVNANASLGFSSGEEEEEEEEEIEGVEEEESIVRVNSSRRVNWTLWKELEIGEFSPLVKYPKGNFSGVAKISSSRSMEEFRSLQWDDSFLAAGTRSELHPLPGDSSAPSTSNFEHRRWGNRLNNDSPQLVQPVRGKLATLSSLLRTLSDRYARRTGKLTPLHERSNKQQRPVLKSSLSAAPVMQPKHQRTNSSSMSRITDDVPMRRYDNPFQDFLRRSYAERNSRFANEEERER